MATLSVFILRYWCVSVGMNIKYPLCQSKYELGTYSLIDVKLHSLMSVSGCWNCLFLTCLEAFFITRDLLWTTWHWHRHRHRHRLCSQPFGPPINIIPPMLRTHSLITSVLEFSQLTLYLFNIINWLQFVVKQRYNKNWKHWRITWLNRIRILQRLRIMH